MKRLGCQLLALAAATKSVTCLELAGQQLSSILTIQDASTSIFEFYNGDKVVKTISAVDLTYETTIQLQNNSLVRIPVALFQAARNVVSIDISHNPLTELGPHAFENLPFLQSIICTHTRLRVVPTAFASNCPSLTSIALNQSRIRILESKALVNLPQLESIFLAHNNVSVLHDDAFVNLSALQTLDMSFNVLETIPTSILTASSSWKVLDFSHNHLFDLPSGIHHAVVQGYISFDYNQLVDLPPEALLDASSIHELRLASNAIFTIHSRAFAGMTALESLTLSDNVISVIDHDAFQDVTGLKELRLDANHLHRLTLSTVPATLERLELQNNRLDLMPDLSDETPAARLVFLNLSQNRLWSLSTNDALSPYTHLQILDVSHNRLHNFSAAVFDPILTTITAMNFDSNRLTSIPRTNFLALVQKLHTNITLRHNPAIAWSRQLPRPSPCPNGSIFESISFGTSEMQLVGCIQCAAGSYHDQKRGLCVACTHVSPRAYTEHDGATTCRYCPYSSDLNPARTRCHVFQCNFRCWWTLALGLTLPSAILCSKVVLYIIRKRSNKPRQVNFHEQERWNEWRMELLLTQFSQHPVNTETRSSASGCLYDATTCLYEFPEETQDVILSTMHDYFHFRKEKRWRALSPAEQESTRAWHDLEWDGVVLERLLHRTAQHELFLGRSNCTHVVVQRFMTRRFPVRTLLNMLQDVEIRTYVHHPHLVACYGTLWATSEHFCLLSEYTPRGDLTTILERTPSIALSTKFQLILDLCQALAYLHGRGIAHRAVSCRKLLVNDVFRCKLNDLRHHRGTTQDVAMQLVLVDEEGGGLFESEGRTLCRRPGPWVSLIPPEVVFQTSRYLETDIYYIGIVLLQVWFPTYLRCQKDTPTTNTENDHQLAMHHFMSKLRLLASGETCEADERSFGTTPTSSAASLTLSLSSTPIVDHLTRIIQDCLQRNPKKRPSASTLSTVFQGFVEELKYSTVAAGEEGR